MNKALKRLISLALVAVMVLGIVPANISDLFASAGDDSSLHNGWSAAKKGCVYDYVATTKEQGEKYYNGISTLLDDDTSGKVYKALFDYKKGKTNYSVFGGKKNVYTKEYQCFQYSDDMSKLITGKSMHKGTKRQYETFIGGAKAGDRPDATELKNFIEEYATTGEFIYFWWKTDTKASIHSITFLSCDENGIYFIDNTSSSTPNLCLKYISYKSLSSLVYNDTDKSTDTFFEIYETIPGSNANLFVSVDECKKKTPTDVYKTGKTKTACQLSSLPHDPQYNASAGVNSTYIGDKIAKGEKVILLTKVNNGHGGKKGNDWYKAQYNGVTGYIWSGNLESSMTSLPEPVVSNLSFYYSSDSHKTLDGQTLTEETPVRITGKITTYSQKMESVSFVVYEYNDSTKKYDNKVIDASESINKKEFEFIKANKTTDSCLNAKFSISKLKPAKYQYSLFLNLERMSTLIESGTFTIKSKSAATTTVTPAPAANSSNTVSAETLAKDIETTVAKAKDILSQIIENSKNTTQKVETPASQKPSSTSTTSSTSASTVYVKGIYKTPDNNIKHLREKVGSSNKSLESIPAKTEITVTEISSNGWGKTEYNGKTGWVQLDNCKYLREIPKINKPGKVTVTYNSTKDIPTGKNVEVKWNAIGDTDSYTVYLKNSSGKVIATQEKITGTKTSFNIANAGTYYFTVRAVNSKYTGDESAASASFTAHAPCKVTFKYWNNKTEVRTVTYGEDAVAPVDPTRAGYKFIGWDNSYTKVTSDITVNAKYEKKPYTVVFTTDDGRIIGKSQSVLYQDSAVEPGDDEKQAHAEPGYVFVGWSNDNWKCVTGNVTVKAIYSWENADLPVVITNPVADQKTTDAGEIYGYNVTFNLSCPKGSMENGRAIVSLKTSKNENNKQIVTTESAAFSLNNDTNGKLIEVFVPSVDYAWKCEIYIVDSFGNPLPLSNMAECPITRIKNEIETTWSGWTPDVKTGYAAREQRTTYSYRTKSTKTANTQSLSGWTYDYTSSSKGSVVSNLSSKPAAVNTDAQVRSISSTTTDVYSTWYRYVHYTNGGYNTSTKKSTTWACAPTKGNTSDGYGPTSIGPHYYESSKKLTPEKSTTFNVNKYKATCSASVSTPATNCTCKNTWFYNETPFQKKTGTKTTYSYQDTFYTYYFYKWSAWSSYSTTAQTASSTKEVRTRTEYRYRYDVTKTVSEDVSQKNQDDSGVARLATTKHAGLLKTDIPLPNLKAQAGKTLIMYICKHNEASDWTGEFIGQTKIDSNGDYQFKFTLREEPTAETGDFIVTIGVEGCKDIITVGSITAPEPEYKVVFKAKDPSKNDSEYIEVKKETVIEGQPVTAPQNPEYPGYKFLGWDTDLSYVTESNMFVEYGKSKEEKTITFTAKYDPIEYDVLFIDWDSDRFEHQVYHYGDTIIPPVLVAEDGHEAVWDGLTEGQTVAGDMVITAKRDKKNYDVVFYDFDGNVIDTQTVPYQDEAEEVEITEDENMIFLGWEYTEEYPEETVNGEIVVGEDPVVKFYPVYVFAEDTASPAASVVTGTYDDVQTVELTCETEGAVIYYTLDGSDPRINGEDGELAKSVYEYSEPIVLNRSTVLTFYAEAFEHNASEPVVEYYAINAGVEESDWMPYDELPDYVTENPSEYNMQSTAGYRFKDVITTSNLSTIQDCENNGWTLVGKVTDTEGSDWMLSNPVLDDTDFELEIREPEEEEEPRYQYSRYRYVDASTGEVKYAPSAPDDVESILETIQFEDKLSLAGYVSGTSVKYYLYEGEIWYNYEIVTIMVKPDYKMYRYFLNTSTYSRWTPWTVDAPAADESRETQTETLWKYSIPETHLVNIDYNGAEFGVGTETFIVEKNDLVPFNVEDYTHEGYDFIGFFTDEEYTHFFDITDTPITADMTLYPKYSAHTFDVIFIDYDGTVLSEETVDYGDWAMEPEVNGKDGYVFIGWDTEDYSFVSEDLIIEAQYVPENEYCTVKLDRNKYNMMAGNSFRLNASITPEDTENPNVIWYSTDEEVAVVDDEGNVTALAEGFAEIVVEAESTGEIDVCALTVSANPSDEICLSYTSSLSLDKDFDLLRGVKNNTWTASSIKDEFMNDAEDLVITDINGVELAEDAIVGTGAVIKFMNGDTVKDEITVVVTGDMNGDGKVNNRDAAMITRYLVDKETASFAQMCAIDVNGDGNINVRDASMVSRYLVGKEEI